MAVGAASVEALSADTIRCSEPGGPGTGMFDLGSAWTQPGAKDRVLRLKRWPVASTWDCGQRPAEHVVTDWER